MRDTQTPIIDSLVQIRTEQRKHSYHAPVEWTMSEATLEALAAECHLPVRNPDTLTVDGVPQGPEHPTFMGLRIVVDDDLEFGFVTLAEWWERL